MSERQLSGLAAVLLALIVAFACVQYASTRRTAPDSLWSGKAAEIERLSLAGGGQKISFERKDGRWTMTEPLQFPADGASLDDIAGRLPDVKLSPYLSDNPAKLGLFEVDASSGVRFTVYASGKEPAIDAWLGKSGSRFDSLFLRREGSNEVREATGLARYLIAKKPKEWLDKTIVAVTSDSLESFKLTSSSGTVVAENKGGGWRLLEPKVSMSTDAAKAAFEPMFSSLLRLEADDLILQPDFPAPKKAGFKKPYLALELRMKGGGTTTISVGNGAQPGNRYVRKEGEDRVMFELANWKLQPFTKSAADLKRKPS